MLLKELCMAWGPSGREHNVSDIIKREADKLGLEYFTDALGNVIVHKKGTKTKIMLAAHIDEIGVCATFIDKNGFVRFSNIGGVYVKRLLNRRVQFENGVVGIIDTEADNKDLKMSKMYIDIGAKDQKDAESKISVGDMAVFLGDYIEQNDVIISKALDNRAGAYVLLKAMEKVNTDNDLYFVFTVQEEVGLRGAKASAYSVDPEVALAVDVTDTGDTPNCDLMAVELGKGACVKVMDRSIITHPDIRCALIETAKDNNIDYQLEVMTAGGTDAGVIHQSRAGVKTGGISIPTRYIHSPSEMVSMKDLDSAVNLLTKFTERDDF
ncbi:MAG: M42 family metallopeptidase [Clostridia bacterium]|nr:M42 family metallopeptidase [Clostridia bacterium]